MTQLFSAPKTGRYVIGKTITLFSVWGIEYQFKLAGAHHWLQLAAFVEGKLLNNITMLIGETK